MKRMSSTINDNSSYSNFKYHADQLSPTRSKTIKVPKNETFSSLDSDLPQDASLVKENDILKKKLELI